MRQLTLVAVALAIAAAPTAPTYAQDSSAPAPGAPATAPTAEERRAALPPAPPIPEAEISAARSAFREQLAPLSQSDGLTADAAAAAAVASAPSLERSEAALRLAQAGADRAWLGVLPLVEVGTSYTRLSDVDQGSISFGGLTADELAAARTLAGSVTDPSARLLWNATIDSQAALSDVSFPQQLNIYRFYASVGYPVSDVFLRVLPAHRAAESAIDANEHQLAAQAATVDLQTREAYFEYARALATLDVANTTVEQIDIQRRQVGALVSAGAVARVELLRLEAQLASARVGASRAHAGVGISRRAVQILMHVDASPDLPLAEGLLDESPLPVDDLGQLEVMAIDGRPEVAALRAIERSRNHAIRANRGGTLPQFLVQANVEYSNPNSRVFPQEDSFNGSWDISAVLRWNMNQALESRAATGQARAELDQVQADLAAIEDALRIEVTQSYEAHRAAQSALEQSWTGLAAAQESYRVRTEQLRAGTVVVRDVIDAEADLARARLEVINALVARQIARAQLSRAIAEDEF